MEIDNTMKNIFLAFALLIGCAAFSQGLTLGDTSPKPLTLDKGKVYQNGEQIPSYQVKKILASNLHSLHAWQSAKTKETLGGALLGLGTAMTVVDLSIGLFSDVKYPTALTYVGLASVAVSIPILCGRSKKVKDAIDSYNEGLKNVSASDIDVNAFVNQNGVGFQISF